MNQFELEKLWVSVPGIQGVAYHFGDEVRVKAGEHAGEVGRVVALTEVEPTPVYVVEFMLSGLNLVSQQSNLEPIA